MVGVGRYRGLPGLEGRPRRPVHQAALRVATLFTLLGIAWVLLTDIFLYRITDDAVLIARIETAKGWMFVGLASGVLYLVTLRATRRLARAKETLAATIESIGDGILILGPRRRIVYANAAAARMLRCERPSDVVGMGGTEFSRRFRVSYPDGA